ncbi:hypothetical protein MP638_002853 [Amoeboaphelidium occidentale]|nr:hypothetical protein MP638_002853 [Amoeboaphelidium occidentale]
MSPTVETKTVKVGGAKNGGTRVVPVHKPPKFYPAEDAPKPKKCRKVAKPTKLRKTITPGTVLVLLAGKYRGKRVVFIKQLPSGLLLVSGPFAVNGVPLRRVNQAYVIATSTKVDISSVQIPESVTDAFFKKEEAKKDKKPTEEGMFEKDGKKEKKEIPAARKEVQAQVDKALVSAIDKVEHLRDYIRAPFTLTRGQFPHKLVF